MKEIKFSNTLGEAADLINENFKEVSETLNNIEEELEIIKAKLGRAS